MDQYSQNTGDFCTLNLNWTCSLSLSIKSQTWQGVMGSRVLHLQQHTRSIQRIKAKQLHLYLVVISCSGMQQGTCLSFIVLPFLSFVPSTRVNCLICSYKPFYSAILGINGFFSVVRSLYLCGKVKLLTLQQLHLLSSSETFGAFGKGQFTRCVLW